MAHSSLLKRRANLGCGLTPTLGWINIDNSPTVLLARSPLRFLLRQRSRFLEAIRAGKVRYGNALATGLHASSMDVVYSSHMLEHLDRNGARRFLNEARRILKPGGILRIVIPDLAVLTRTYAASGDANAFVASLYMATETQGFWGRVRGLLMDGRQHRWMYDAQSLGALLAEAGFENAVALPAGKTSIPEPGWLNLREREAESLYMEAQAPGGVAASPLAKAA